MPEYLAPGVYVEEVSFRSKSIEGVSTSTTAFVGETLKGPTGVPPSLLTNFGDFERIYGGLDDIEYFDQAGNKVGEHTHLNYIAHAVRAYFDNGGRRLYVSRVMPSTATIAASQALAPPQQAGANRPPNRGATANTVEVKFIARFKGKGGEGSVTLYQQETPVSFSTIHDFPVGSFLRNDEKYYLKTEDNETLGDWKDETGKPLEDTQNATPPTAGEPSKIQMAVVTLAVVTSDSAGNSITYGDLGLDPNHPRYIGQVLNKEPSRQTDFLLNPFAIALPPSGITAFQLFTILKDALHTPKHPENIKITGGLNGNSPPNADDFDQALKQLDGIEDISILAAPGYSAYQGENIAQSIQNRLITYVSQRRRYQIAVLDTPPKHSPDSIQLRLLRSNIDSKYAALYYPWVTVANPLWRPGNFSQPAEINLPPSGFVCGIYARNDNERGVYKAPANEVVLGALRFEYPVNFGQQEVLNPLGINCLRSFPNRGHRVWGARLVSSDPEWKYVNVRRYFNYLEASIDRGTQWAVFEPNGEALWANIRETISDFLYNEWVSRALLGGSPDVAYFVRCDRSTMTQNDLDNGRLICLIGVAVIKPAEFVIFRIGQKTADSNS